MFDLLGEASRELSARGVGHVLIGAGALAAHGVSRSTHDLDLLATDPRVLQPGFWSALGGAGVAVEARLGDHEDPLAGVVRLSRIGDRSVDVVVGRAAWQSEMFGRAAGLALGGIVVPVAAASDLVLLKLFAGGPQDLWDVQQLLAAGDRRALSAAVEQVLPRLPPDARVRWVKALTGT